MSSRDLWIRAGNTTARELLASLLTTRLLMPAHRAPLYLASPYLTDFPLLQNHVGQFRALFRHHTEFGEQTDISFSEVLVEIATSSPVFILTVPGENADPFVDRLRRYGSKGISIRHLEEPFHAKGLACSDFFIEGSMNFTYSGLYNRDEKITINSRESEVGRQKIDNALLELSRTCRLNSRAKATANTP